MAKTLTKEVSRAKAKAKARKDLTLMGAKDMVARAIAAMATTVPP